MERWRKLNPQPRDCNGSYSSLSRLGAGFETVRTLFGASLLLKAVILVGCGSVPMGVDPLPYYVIDKKQQKVVTNQLCELYATYGFVDCHEECSGSWKLKEIKNGSLDRTPETEGEVGLEVETTIELKRGSKRMAEVEMRVRSVESTEDEDGAIASQRTSYTEFDVIRKRNELQHSILGIATNQCNEYKKALAARSTSGVVNASVAALLLSAGTALFGGESTPQALAASAGAFVGISALIEDKYEGDLTAALTGIEIARTRIFRQILRSQRKNLVDYPVSRAVNDAIRYHSVCNLVEGVAEVSKSLKTALEQAAREADPSR